MMDEQNGQAPVVQSDDQQTEPAASPVAAPESAESEKVDSGEQAAA